MNAQQLRREEFNQAKNHEMILAVRYNAKASTGFSCCHRASLCTDFLALLVVLNYFLVVTWLR